MTSSATPGAERTPPSSSEGSAAGGPRLRRWRRSAGRSELSDLGDLAGGPVSARTAEIGVDDLDDLDDDPDPAVWRREFERAQAAADQAARSREAAERAAREHEFRARTEAQRREVAEQLAAELAESLEETQVALLEQAQAVLAAERARADAEPPAAEPPATTPPAPTPRIRPEDRAERPAARSRTGSAVLSVLLGLGALAAAGFTVYQAYLDRLTAPPGLAASAATLLLVVALSRLDG